MVKKKKLVNGKKKRWEIRWQEGKTINLSKAMMFSDNSPSPLSLVLTCTVHISIYRFECMHCLQTHRIKNNTTNNNSGIKYNKNYICVQTLLRLLLRKTLVIKLGLKCLLKWLEHWLTFLIANGHEFNRAGAAEENARSPRFILDLNLGVLSNVPI